MRLSLHTDYALRTLIFLEAHRGRLVATREVAEAYGISDSHLSKVAQHLTGLGAVEAVRGRSGGIRLGKAAGDINIGRLVRELEGETGLIECFDEEINACPISPACGLKKGLWDAQNAFFEVLERYTLADISENRSRLVTLLEG